MFNIEPIVAKSKQSCIMIAGPCVAESQEQLVETASSLLAKSEIDLFRCGVWKPRSSPNNFEGYGLKALSWLQEIQVTYQVPVCIEIASAYHLEKALNHGIKTFWIGARTTVNPFLVQAIADASKGCDISIMIKNPIAPDLNLWIGAFERFAKANIQRLAAIHRGFSTYELSIYRNNPLWSIPIELKRLHPEIPIICDPSHIAGDKKHIAEVAQKALYLAADGLMIEVHHAPNQALSDKQQQLSPYEYQKLINELYFSSTTTLEDIELRKLREQIDELDKDLCCLLSKRFDVVREIAAYKKEKNMSLLQINRWKELLNTILNICEAKKIDKVFMQKIMEIIHEESIQLQEKIIKENT
ncbi:MAG: bifunctional 3-deoxy-7-phosphoheptulonate synthase/chorismate mutase type II [Bacteroidales bacterium]|nr:bifunctional 3-deoxy-7-phosphoheptulonate synthase/chorismate mutase type II [Bacteroidales bacterium]